MPGRSVRQVLQLVAGDHHRLHRRRRIFGDQRDVAVAGGEHRALAGDRLRRDTDTDTDTGTGTGTGEGDLLAG